MPLAGQIHWEGCWEAHHECAIAKIKELQAELDQMQDLFDMLDIAIFDNHIVKVVAKKQ